MGKTSLWYLWKHKIIQVKLQYPAIVINSFQSSIKTDFYNYELLPEKRLYIALLITLIEPVCKNRRNFYP